MIYTKSTSIRPGDAAQSDRFESPNCQLPQPGGELLCAGPVQFPLLSLGAVVFIEVASISIDSKTGGVQTAFDFLSNIPHSTIYSAAMLIDCTLRCKR